MPLPKVKLSGFISLCKIYFLWIYSNLVIICSANMHTVFNENLKLFSLNNISRDFPNNSITRTLYSPEKPYDLIKGIPSPFK